MAKTSVDIPQLKFNKMSTAKYEELKLAGQLVDNEFYITPDGGTIPEINETTNDFVLSNNGTDLNWTQETEYTKNRIDSKLNDNVRTNCITKIPQDIKLELVDGILTLKSGSKIYDGAGNPINIIKDYIVDITNSNGVVGVYYSQNQDKVWANQHMSLATSGTTPPEGTGMFYNTSTKSVDFYSNGSVSDANWSLPLAIITTSNGALTTINQIFNGFGYIGSTIFALPDIEGLIPNGRNADGSLNNTKFVTTNVLTSTRGFSGSNKVYVRGNSLTYTAGVYYNKEENKNIGISDGLYSNYCESGTLFADSTGKITLFSPKNVFQAVDRNDTNWASFASKPSDKFIDLTLEASDAFYTMPANGYLCFAKLATASGQFIYMGRNAEVPSINIHSSFAGYLQAFLPCRKGDKIRVGYDAGGTTAYFKFIYDEGEI